MWPGYKAVLVPEINMDIVGPILELIMTVWCSNNLEHYNYFSHLVAFNVLKWVDSKKLVS